MFIIHNIKLLFDFTEPGYCLGVFDMARKARVSETFYFDFNGEKTDKIYKDPAGKILITCEAQELER